MPLLHRLWVERRQLVDASLQPTDTAAHLVGRENRCLSPLAAGCRSYLIQPPAQIVDVTIFNVPSSPKNATKARDREMRQTKKGATPGTSP